MFKFDKLLSAIAQGNHRLLECIIKDSKIDPSLHNNQAILLAAKCGFSSIMNLLLQDRRVDPSAQNNTAVIDVCAYNHKSCLKLLLQDARVDPSVRNNYPLRVACSNGYHKLVKLLLRHPKVDPSDLNNQAIISSFHNVHVKVAKALMEDSRVDVKARNNECLKAVLENGNFNLYLLLDPWLNADDCTILLKNRFSTIVLDALKRGKVTDISFRDDFILRWACKAGNLNLVRELLLHNVNPASRNQECIISAAKDGNLEIVKLLLKDSRVDPTVFNNLPLKLAKKGKHSAIVDILSKTVKDIS